MPIFRADDLRNTAPLPHPSIIGNGLLPEVGKMLVVGETEAGKSALAFDIAMCLIMQKPLFGAERRKHDEQQGKPLFPVHRPVSVLYIDTELGPQGCHDRLKPFYERYEVDKIGGLGDAFHISSGTSGYRFHNLRAEAKGIGGFDRLWNLVSDIKPDVLIPDPLIEFHLLDENSSELHGALSNLNAIQNQFGCAVILTHHESGKDFYTQTGRKVQKDAIDRARGHSSLVGWADTILCVQRHPIDEPRCFIDICWAKCRRGPRPPNGVCFADLERMYLQWVTAVYGGRAAPIEATKKVTFREKYEKQFPSCNSIYYKEREHEGQSSTRL